MEMQSLLTEFLKNKVKKIVCFSYTISHSEVRSPKHLLE